ncbi:hypothetical protein [Streptomyces sp. col6]|uniref:hypothetical protein n=1 Tax=Streptomyces sp. col6 TaxID=2478958 RepID=UPI0011CDCCEE|nr:hypothetical protein [Streptomyces sp. col6]
MQIMDGAELLRREALWLREIASRTRLFTAELPDLDDEELRKVRKAVLHAWFRYRCPVSLQFVTNYVAVSVTAVGMAVVSSGAGGVAALFARNSEGSTARAPWWLFLVATWAAVCLSLIVNARSDWRQIASLLRHLGLRGLARRLTSAHVGTWFVPAVALVLVVVAVVTVWLSVVTALSAPVGQQLIIAAAAGLFGAVLGLVGNRWILSIQELLRRKYRARHGPRPLDGLLVELLVAAAVTFQGRASWWDLRHIKSVRRRLAFAIEAAQDTSVIRRRTTGREWAARRRARAFHAMLAELIRRHDRAVTQVCTAEEYDTIAASLRAGVLALAVEDLPGLMQHSTAEPSVSRVARLVRRAASSLVLVVFALVIPILPGVDGATGGGVRVLLLMTAALALTPANDLASSSVRSALERSLVTKSTS